LVVVGLAPSFVALGCRPAGRGPGRGDRRRRVAGVLLPAWLRRAAPRHAALL